MTQFKWKKVSQYCVECNNYYISKYIVADNAKFILWDGHKMLKVSDKPQELKNYAMDYNATQPKRDNRSYSIIGYKRDLHDRSEEKKKQPDQRSKQATLGLFVS